MNILAYLKNNNITKLQFARACGLNHATEHSMIAKVDTWIRSGYIVYEGQLMKPMRVVNIDR